MASLPGDVSAGRDPVVGSPPSGDRGAGYAAFSERDPGVDILDLEFDSIIDTPEGPAAAVRRLTFAGPDCTVEAEVYGVSRVRLDVRVSIPGRVVVDVCTKTERGQDIVAWSPGLTLSGDRPKLTSIFLRWPESSRRPARTAWVLI